MNTNNIHIEILEKRLTAIHNSHQYSLVEVPGNQDEIFLLLINRLNNYYKRTDVANSSKNKEHLFNPFHFSMFDKISNFSVLHMMPISFLYKLLFDTDIFSHKVLSTSSDNFLVSADVNLLQAIYFYKTFYVQDMSRKEYEDTFTLLCLVEPNILFRPVDVEDILEFWDVIPFIEFCSKEGFSINHLGKALNILENEDTEIISNFISTHLYNFQLFKPLLKYCSKEILINIAKTTQKIPEIIIDDFYQYIHSEHSIEK